MSAAVMAHLAERRGEILERLKALIRIPSVSTDPAYAADMQRARDLLTGRLRELGFQDVQELGADGGQKAVFGQWCGAPGRPTVIVYGHYDVQPADPLELWTTPPFEPVERAGRLYGRGASDVKGSTIIAVEAVGAFLTVAGALPVNVKLFLEGEEESGSPSLREIVARHRALLEADVMLSADGGRASTRVPTVGVGFRGLTGLQFTLRTAAKDGHSGRYGGAARNALHDMAALIASLHDERGVIQVAGYGEDATPISNAARVATAALPFEDEEFYGAIGGAPWGDPAYSVRERVTLRPTIEVNGMWGGYTGAGSKTVLPSEAHAKITMRLAPGMDPRRAQAALRAHLEERTPRGAALIVTQEKEGTPAPSVPEGHPLLLAALRVLEREHARPAVPARAGGTLPVSAVFRDMLGIDTLAFGLAMPDEDVHAPNEFFRLSSFDEGLRTWPALLTELGGLTAEEFAGFRHG